MLNSKGEKHLFSVKIFFIVKKVDIYSFDKLYHIKIPLDLPDLFQSLPHQRQKLSISIMIISGKKKGESSMDTYRKKYQHKAMPNSWHIYA